MMIQSGSTNRKQGDITKNTILIYLILFALLTLPACGNAYYDEGFEDGYADGYADGYFDAEYETTPFAEEEFEDGYDIGYDDGYDAGYEEGLIWSEGAYSDEEWYEEGYNDGHSDGYYAGATYSCLFYGDLNRAFQSATNGCAWETFLDAYDQYISNIFDDNETRSTLLWALISVTVSNDATVEEIELLISTFGEDIFVENGFILE